MIKVDCLTIARFYTNRVLMPKAWAKAYSYQPKTLAGRIVSRFVCQRTVPEAFKRIKRMNIEGKLDTTGRDHFKWGYGLDRITIEMTKNEMRELDAFIRSSSVADVCKAILTLVMDGDGIGGAMALIARIFTQAMANPQISRKFDLFLLDPSPDLANWYHKRWFDMLQWFNNHPSQVGLPEIKTITQEIFRTCCSQEAFNVDVID